MTSICHTPDAIMRGWDSFHGTHRHTPEIVVRLCVVFPLKVGSAAASAGAPGGGGSSGGGATAMDVDTPSPDSSGSRGKVSKRSRLGGASTRVPPSLVVCSNLWRAVAEIVAVAAAAAAEIRVYRVPSALVTICVPQRLTQR